MWGARNQTDPDCYRSSSSLQRRRKKNSRKKTHILISAYFLSYTCVCVSQMNRLLNEKRMIRGVSVCSSLSSLLLFFLLLSGAEAPKQKNKKKIETEWTDPPPHLSPALSPSLSLPLTVQISFPYFLQPSSIFMLSPVSSISLSLPPPSLSSSSSSSLCRRVIGHCWTPVRTPCSS